VSGVSADLVSRPFITGLLVLHEHERAHESSREIPRDSWEVDVSRAK
jgi:hypothetical protein